MLEKVCSVCGSRENTEVETVTNVVPSRDEMYPVLLCARHKAMLAEGQLDIRLNSKGDLTFFIKKQS